MNALQGWPRGTTWLLILCSVAALPRPLAAQTPAPLSYRRVFVPSELLPSQIRGLVPLGRNEFERRILLANAQPQPAVAGVAARVTNGVFQARFVEQQLHGTARLTIESPATAPTLLALDPGNLALAAARWTGGTPQSAIIGANDAGKLHCVVERGGTLELDWSLAPAETSTAWSVFQVRLPPATTRRLEILTPPGVELEADSGIVSQGSPAEAPANERLWRLDLSGGSEVRLSLRSHPAAAEEQPHIIVREEVDYSVLPTSFDVEAIFSLDVLDASVAELQLCSDAGLQVIAVRLGDRELPFHLAAAERSGQTLVTCELGQPLRGNHHTLEVRAAAEWTGDAGRVLPRIQVAGGQLQAGKWSVSAPEWLGLIARPLRGCVQTHAAPAIAGRTAERSEFQVFATDAAVEVSASAAAWPLSVRSGTQITVEANQVLGVVVAELTGVGRGRFDLAAEVPRQWIVDSVETEPAESLVDRSLTASGTGPQRLQLKLAQPILPERPLRLILRGHYRRSATGEVFGRGAFQLASFPTALVSRRLVALRVTDPGAELSLSGDENLVRLDPERLAAADRGLFATPPETLLFEANAAADAVEAALRPANASYRADVLVRATVTQSDCEQTVSIRCQPEATAVGSVVVRLSPRPRGVVVWRLVADAARELVAAAETSGAGASLLDEGVYRLLLPRSASAPFEISGEWSGENPGAVSLVLLPEANRQTGIVEVHSAVGPLEIDAQDVRPLPRPAAPEAGLTRQQARYSYETGQRARVAIKSAPGGLSEFGAWIELLQVASYVAPGGSGEHVATLTVRNAGASHLVVRLPKDAGECRLVSGADTFVLRRGTTNEVEVPLAAGQENAVIQLHYSTTGPAVGAWPVARIRMAVPQVEVPVLARVWRVGLPPGFAPLASWRGAQVEQPATAAGSVRTPQIATDSYMASWRSNLSWLLAGPAAFFAPPAGEPSLEVAFRGWAMFSRDLVDGEEPVITVYRPTVLAAWAWGGCLAVTAVVLRLRLRAGFLVPLVGLLVAVAVVASSPVSWFAAGAGLGFALGGALRAVTPRHAAAGRLAGRRSLLPAPATVCVAAMVGCAWARGVFAAPPDAPPQVARVVFPTAANDLPEGDYVYLDPTLYDLLHRRADRGGAEFPEWVLESAEYHFPTAPRPSAAGAVVDEFKVRYELHTFGSGVAVQLPLRRDQVSLLDRRALVDGLPASLAWSSDGRKLGVTVAAPGKHRLELALAATAQSIREAVLLELATPSAAFTKVELPGLGPAGGEIPGALPHTTLAGGSRVFQLAAANLLTVRWPANGASAPPVATLEAEQLAWWKLHAASAVLEAEFVVRTTGAPLTQIVLEVDPRLRPLPGLTSGNAAHVQAEEGVWQRTAIELAEPTTEARVRLGWLWPETLGAGTLTLPRVSVVADQTARDWTAISLESGLEIASLPNLAKTLDAAEFLRAWGDAAAPPTLAYLSPASGQRMPIAIHPAQALPSSEQVVEWSIAGSLVSADGVFQLTDVPSTCFEHRFSLPPELRVTRVTVTQAERPADLRWTQLADGQLIVTLFAAPAKTQTIALHAELAVPANSSQFRLPRLELGGAERTHAELRIYQHADVALTVPPARGWSAIPPVPLAAPRAGLGRLVAALRQSHAEFAEPLVVERRTNRPQVSGKMLILTDQADGDWRSEVALDLQIAGGRLDCIRLLVPEDWAWPLEIEPPMEYRLEPAAREARRLLVIIPPRDTTDRWRFRVRGPLQVGAGGVQAPDIQLLNANAVERLIGLDRGSAGQPIDWETSGLAAADSAALARLDPAWQHAAAGLFRVIAPEFQAAVRYRPSVGGVAEVFLADIRTVLTPGRRVVTAADYLVNPVDAQEVIVELPAGCRLVQALVDGFSVACRQAGLRTWKLAAPSDLFPYEVTIIYDSFWPAQAGATTQLSLAAPRLRNMRMPAVLWSVRGANELRLRASPVFDRSDAGAVTTAVGNEDAELIRLEANARALDAVLAARGSSVPRAALVEGFDRWQRLLEAADGRLASVAPSDHLSQSVSLRRQAALAAAKAAQQRLVQAGILDEEHTNARRAAAPGTAEPPAAVIALAGADQSIEVEWQRPAHASSWPRSLLALWIALSSFALVALRRVFGI